MNIEIIPLMSFVVVTTFTPGPNNISSASMGVTYGYKKTFSYLMGISSGFFVVMMACAYLSGALLNLLPSAERYLRWVGACYILWLAISILHSNPSTPEPERTAKAFTKGFIQLAMRCCITRQNNQPACVFVQAMNQQNFTKQGFKNCS